MPAHSNGPENIFNAGLLLSEAETDILTIIYILGMDPALQDSFTIDEIINKIKESYNYRDAEATLQGPLNSQLAKDASTKVLRVECNSLLRRIRRAWFNKEFSIEVM